MFTGQVKPLGPGQVGSTLPDAGPIRINPTRDISKPPAPTGPMRDLKTSWPIGYDPLKKMIFRVIAHSSWPTRYISGELYYLLLLYELSWPTPFFLNWSGTFSVRFFECWAENVERTCFISLPKKGWLTAPFPFLRELLIGMFQKKNTKHGFGHNWRKKEINHKVQ